MSVNFIEWLDRELARRGWSQNELARRMGKSPGGLSMIRNQQRGVSAELCKELARAFEIPETVVFEAAGLLSPARGEGEATLRELWEMLRDLPVEDQCAILDETRQRWQKTQPNGIKPATN